MKSLSIIKWLSGAGASQLRTLFASTPEQACGWLRILSLEGMAQAQVCYGRMLLEGTGTTRDARSALAWFQRAAARGDLEACNMVGRCLEHGWGVAIDLGLAAAFYHKAADAGHAWAQYNLGHCYLDGLGVQRDQYVAYGYYRRAASQGHARAMNLVGRCCEEGWGTPKNFSAASAWYRLSAEGGYFRGQYNWAVILLKCNMTDEATLWFERAAASGTPAVREAVRQAMGSPTCQQSTSIGRLELDRKSLNA